ncbi:MAG: ABC transporter ATP-binding protein, partial [Oscillospiraceae bacterium]|nr:ABC transporter ATP-binding protein [Oscillospiraceae bacterium]
MILSMQNICKDYTHGKLTVPVLHDICLEMDSGEYVAIMGPSGSGKTTLMNIIGCLDKATSGTYLFSNRDISTRSDDQLASIRNRHIGFVFQNFYLLPNLSALDNVALPLMYGGVPKKRRIEQAKAALRTVGLEDRMAFRPN